MRHLPSGIPKTGRVDKIEGAVAAERGDVEADGEEGIEAAGDAEAEGIGAAGARGAGLSERANGTEPVADHGHGGRRGPGLTAQGVAPPVEFEALVVVVFDDLADLLEHEGADLRAFIIKASPVTGVA